MKVLQAKDILVLAGPSACGKSTLIRELLRDGPLAGQVLHQLGLPVEVRRGKLNLQRLVNAQAMHKKSRKNRVGVVVVQFDVLSCYRHQRAAEFEQVGHLISDVLDGLAKNPEGDAAVEKEVKAKVRTLCEQFPIYPNL